MVSQKQWERVQRYIRLGTDEGARLIAGGEGRPDGIGAGWFVRPTVFSDVTNDMAIAREEIFGPVLSIITYRDTEDAISIANDTNYGLHEPAAPFGGFKQSGIGREYGTFGLEAFLEPQAVLAA
jgi:aldehyde dehydrogenase (NAD+)